jgi:hypothetical protein
MLVSGMIIGTVFTLLVLPSIYMLLARTRVAVAVEESAPRAIAAPATPEGALA